jgi:hypothetical protein
MIDRLSFRTPFATDCERKPKNHTLSPFAPPYRGAEGEEALRGLLSQLLSQGYETNEPDQPTQAANAAGHPGAWSGAKSAGSFLAQNAS